MLFARVRVSIERRPSGGLIVRAGFGDEARVPTIWKKAALQGANQAVRKAGIADALVVLTQIQGTTVDTVPSAVAIAAYLAVCDSMMEATPSKDAIGKWLDNQPSISFDDVQDTILESLDRTDWIVGQRA